ncbi:MAG: metallophosphoesterase [Clostridia bacterium]|nr:metallophosphoesterase [Clostridia bacterium]
MICFISDLHGNSNFSGLKVYLNIAADNDLLIILGDIGLFFEDSEDNRIFNNCFLSIDKKIALVDGNYENFSYLNSFPEEAWNGGTVRRLTENIVLLKRGNIFNIEGKSFFVFGGCKSSPKWKEMGLWHYGEEPENEELNLAYKNLKKHNYFVDYILTHKYEQSPPRGTVCPKLRELTAFIDNNVQFKKWYAGHWHTNGKFDEKHIFIYDLLTPAD